MESKWERVSVSTTKWNSIISISSFFRNLQIVLSWKERLWQILVLSRDPEIISIKAMKDERWTPFQPENEEDKTKIKYLKKNV